MQFYVEKIGWLVVLFYGVSMGIFISPEKSSLILRFVKE